MLDRELPGRPDRCGGWRGRSLSQVVLLARLAPDPTDQRRSLGGHLLVDCVRGGREFGARALIVDAIHDQPVAFYRHFDFDELDDRRPWRRVADVTRAVGE